MPARGRWAERPFPVDRSVPAVAVDGTDDPAWLARWRAADTEVSRALDELLAAEDGVTPHEVAGAVSRAVPPSGLLHVGASSPIRDLDLMVAPYAVGDRRRVSPTAAWPASTAPSRARSARRWPARTAPATWR